MTDGSGLPEIRMARPSIGSAELAGVADVLASGWLGEADVSARFERKLAEFTGCRDAVAVNTGTSALHLALLGLGIGPGDEVILPSFTFLADPMVVLLVGARPVFGDVDEETFNLDPGRIGERITPRTKAIMPTDYAGLPADTRALRTAIGDRDIRIIRDAAHSFGSCVDGRVVGTWLGEDITCLSFDPIKNLTCGDGGALLIDESGVADAVRVKKRLGRAAGGGALRVGYRYQLSDINAAIGMVQLDRFHSLVEARRRVARRYDELLDSVEAIVCPKRDWDVIVPFMYVVRVAGGHRDSLARHLQQRAIHADLRYPPCHAQPIFRHDGFPLPVTERLARECLSLPLYPDLTDDEIARVVDGIHDYIRGGI
jgi:dTDP-4-amino-4,6-dideoxygalactose transaminase